LEGDEQGSVSIFGHIDGRITIDLFRERYVRGGAVATVTLQLFAGRIDETNVSISPFRNGSGVYIFAEPRCYAIDNPHQGASMGIDPDRTIVSGRERGKPSQFGFSKVNEGGGVEPIEAAICANPDVAFAILQKGVRAWSAQVRGPRVFNDSRQGPIRNMLYPRQTLIVLCNPEIVIRVE
jgi:hypothetical protein